MEIVKQYFDRLEDGRIVSAYTLVNKNGMIARISDYGGTLLGLFVPDKTGRLSDVVGGHDNVYDYAHCGDYQGALVGRIANRIAKGSFTLDGKAYSLYVNNGENHLHGGRQGFSAKLWDAEPIGGDEPSLSLRYVSTDGEEGYPGTLRVKVTYTLTADNALSIRYEAETDKKTIINMTNHSYFNLGGYASGSVREHTLWIDASGYLKTDDGLIPTGELASVEGTPFDFRTEKAVGRDLDLPHEDLIKAGGYDHCFVFGSEESEVRHRATLRDPKSGRVMKMYTNQPCVQLYTGNFLGDDGHPMKGGHVKHKNMALCLETQKMPDSINHEGFTDVTLDKGEKYDYTTIYAFSAE